MMDLERYSITLPGRIVAFDATDQTAEVQISADQVFSDSSQVTQSKKLNTIKRVPVHIPSGGGWSFTTPITLGDTCLLVFSQVGYDHWFYEDKDTAGTIANVPKPWLKRKFSKDDGFALVGFNTIPRAIESYSPDNSEWRNSDATQIIRLLPNDDIEIETPTKVKVIAETVDVDCTTLDVDCTTATVDCDTASVTASTSVTVTTPLLDLICNQMVNITSPLVAQSGNMTIGGTLLVGLGIGGGGAPVPAAGLAVTGPAVISGPATASEVTAGTTVLTQHKHPGDGGTGSGADTGAPI